MGSSRFPGKPLQPILGLPMIQHVYKRCELAANVDELFVATCDEEIASVVSGFGGVYYMTDPAIPRPGLRVAEACRQRDDLADDDIVVVVQGDEPLVHPQMIEVAVQALLDDREAPLGTLVADATALEWEDPNEVKVVTDLRGDILYMTRSPVPSNTRDRFHRRLKQVAIMPFRKRFLLEFQEMAETPLEIDESVELLRAIEHGIRVKAIQSPFESVAVDTERDRLRAEAAMRDDEIFGRYAE